MVTKYVILFLGIISISYGSSAMEKNLDAHGIKRLHDEMASESDSEHNNSSDEQASSSEDSLVIPHLSDDEDSEDSQSSEETPAPLAEGQKKAFETLWATVAPGINDLTRLERAFELSNLTLFKELLARNPFLINSLLVSGIRRKMTVAKIRQLLDLGADQNFKENGKSAVEIAAEHGREDVVNLLLDYKRLQPKKETQGPEKHPLQRIIGDAIEACNGSAIRAILQQYGESGQKILNEYLLCTVITGEVEKVSFLLYAGADCTLKGPDGKSLLMIALENKHKKVAELLLEYPSFVIDYNDSNNSRNMSIIGYAIEQDYEDIINRFLDYYPMGSPDRIQLLANGLVNAVKFDKPQLVRKFLSFGAPPTIQVINYNQVLLSFAITTNKSLETIEMIIRALVHTFSHISLDSACINSIFKHGRLDILSLILNQKIYIALAPIDMNIVKLIENNLGANIKTFEAETEIRHNSNGFLCDVLQREVARILPTCIENNSINVNEFTNLHEHCVHAITAEHPHLRDEQTEQTALHRCCIRGYTLGVLSLTTMPQWYINAQDQWGKTALMYAIVCGRDDCVKALIYLRNKTQPGTFINTCGSGINLKDKEGNTALFYALLKSNFEVAKLLLAQGAKIGSIKKIVLVLEVAAAQGDLKNMLLLLGKYSSEFLEAAKKLEQVKEAFKDRYPDIQIINPLFLDNLGIKFFH